MQISSKHAIAIVERYAEALLRTVKSGKKASKIEQEAQQLVDALDAEGDLTLLIKQLHYQAKQSKLGLTRLFATLKLSDSIEGLIRILAKNKRLLLLRSVLATFLYKAAKDRGELWCRLHTAAPLSAEKLKDISQHIAEALKKTVKMEHEVDPSLLGGMMINFEGHMLDLSATQYLKELKNNVLKTLEARYI